MSCAYIYNGSNILDRASHPEDESKCERFVLIKRNDEEYYSYYTIHAQDNYTKHKLKIERKYFPNLEVLLDFKCSPNSKYLYTRIKETLKNKNVIFKGNNIDLEEILKNKNVIFIGNNITLDESDITEEELIEEMKAIFTV